MAIRIALYLQLVLLCMSTAHAELSFTQLIFDDCDKASEFFSAAPSLERKKLADNLANVLSINLTPPSAPEAFATNQHLGLIPDPQFINGSSGEQWMGLQWKNMDAQRELKAKHCALRILETAGVDAFDQLLPLARMYQANALSNELSVRLEEVAFRIAESSHGQSVIASDELISDMLALTTSGATLVAQNFLEEYREESVPILLKSFSKLVRQNNKSAAHVLQQLDRIDPLLPRFLELLPDLDQESITYLSPLFSVHPTTTNASSLSNTIKLIDRSKQSSTLLHLIGRACLQSPEAPLSAESSAILTKLADLWEPQRLQVEQVRCLLRRSTPLTRVLLELLERKPHEDQGRYIITLLSSPTAFSNKEMSDQAYYTLQRRALDVTSSNAIHALNAMASFERFSTENANTSLSVLRKCHSKKTSCTSKASLEEACLRVLQQSGKGESNPMFAPTVLTQLREESLSQTSINLLASLSSLPERVWWMAGSALRTPSARNALKIISKRREPHLRLATNLIPLLNDPGESPYAAEILYALRHDIAPALKASYPTSTPLGTDSLAVILSGASEPGTSHIKRAIHVYQTAPCSFSEQRVGILRGASQSSQSDLKQSAVDHLKRCFPSYHTETVVSLTQNNPTVIEVLASSLNDSANTPQTAEWISALITSLPITNDSVDTYAPLVAALFKMAPEPITVELLKTLDARESIPAAILDTLRAMIDDIEFASNSYRWEIVSLLARHAPHSLDLPKILELAGNRITIDNPVPIHQALRELPHKEALSIIHNDLKSSDRNALVTASLIGAAFGTRALPIVSQLWNLRLHKDPTVRYTAILALLAINPLSPDLQHAVENILSNRMYEMALVMPVPWSKTLAFIELDQSRFGSLRRARMVALQTVEQLRALQ